MTRAWTFLLQRFCELLSPPICIACEAELLSKEAGPFCDGCVVSLEPCGAAKGDVVTPYLYGGALADAIKRFKYHHAPEVGALLAPLFLRAEARYREFAPTLVVPVPLHPQKLRARGYNQAALLALGLGRALGVRVHPTALRRLRDTESQASLGSQERRNNLVGAFERGAQLSEHERVLLVDDVCTTGATLRACRETLVPNFVLPVALARA